MIFDKNTIYAAQRHSNRGIAPQGKHAVRPNVPLPFAEGRLLSR